MSAKKYRLRELLPSLSAQAKSISDAEIKARFKLLKAVAESPQTVERKCRQEGKSKQYFHKWAKVLLKTKDILSLASRSRRPKRSPRKTPRRVVKRVRKLRELEPFSGPERISQDLKDHFNIDCPPSTVYQVLKREKLISTDGAKKLTKRHLKRYRRPLPGWLQMDFKYVPYRIAGVQFYQLSAIDHHSSWRFIRCYPEKSEAFTVKFLNELIEYCPFPIVQIQTDNDAAFTDKFTSQVYRPTGRHEMDLWCKRHGIEHRLIPVGEKELNGKVENSHKFDDREFFSQVQCLTYEALQVHSRAYNERWNMRRKTKTLGWKTPDEVVEESYVRAIAYLAVMKARYCPNQPAFGRLTEDGQWVIPIDESPAKTQNRPKRLTVVDRYLQYLNWDGNRRLKSLIALCAMSQSSSQELI
ncbi:MAG: transposase [Proteobacteria bacterium]|nr:transposase [Pseudomonadota bacterium]